MDFFGLGDTISYNDYNMIVYLLRKFKRLTSDLTLGNNTISSDYGNYNIAGGLTSVGGNFILEDDVTISSSDVLLNCFYTFYFTVVDVNLSGTVNRRVVSVTGDTGDNGVLEVVLAPSLLESDEVILPDFKVDIVFDEHEYYTPVSAFDVTLSVDKSYVGVGETATITATVLDGSGSPVEDLELGFNINGSVVGDVTDESGVASVEYTGTGVGLVYVEVMGEHVKFYDGNVVVATVTGDSIRLGYSTNQWLGTIGDVVIDWGDDTQSTVNNPSTELTHTYTDGEQSHSIVFLGTVTSLGNSCFQGCTGLTSVVIPNSVTSLGQSCFVGCTGLTSVVIPNSVTSLGFSCFKRCTGLTSITIPNSVTSISGDCFRGCTGLTSITLPNSVTSLEDRCFYGCPSLIDYQLYWTGNGIITYDSDKMPNNTNTIFTIPQGETNNYISKNYPSTKLHERGTSPYHITITGEQLIRSSETTTITAQLKNGLNPFAGETLNYQIKHGDTIMDSGTDTTDSNGEIEIEYTGASIGLIDITVAYNDIEETYTVYDSIKYDKATILDHTDSFWASTSTITRNNEYSSIGSSSGTQLAYTQISGNIGIELDVRTNTFNTGTVIRLTQGSSTTLADLTRQVLGLNQNEWKHIRLSIIDNTLYFEDTSIDITGFNRFYFRSNSGYGIDFKNITVYSLGDNYSLELTGDSIVEKDSTVTVTGVLINNSMPVEGETLSYEVKHGSTVIDSGSDTTDSNGEISISYTGTGVGDVEVIVSYGSLLQETYAIEDCYFYDTLTTDKNLFSIRRGTGTLTYSNTGLTFRDSTSSETNVLFSEQLPTTDYEVSYDIVDYGNTNNKPQVCFEDFFLGINNGGYYGRRISQSGNIWNETGSPTPPHTIKHQITGTSSKTVKTYQNDNLLGTATGISQTREMQIFAYEDGRSITFTNLKIKAL